MYSAISIEGQEIEGIIEAEDKKEVVRQLRQKQFFPVSIRYMEDVKTIRRFNIIPSVTSKDLFIFCKQYASILKSGVPSVQGLHMIINQTTNPTLTKSLQKVYYLVQGGHSLSQAMLKQGNSFPTILIRSIESGEWSGTLEKSFGKMADYFEKQYRIKQKIRKALTYPLILFITAILVICFLMRIVVPQFVIIFGNAQADLPIYTRLLIRMSDFFSHNSILLILLPAITYLIFRLLLSFHKTKLFLHKIVLKIPYLGSIINKIIAARFNRSVAILISAGLSINHSLTISSKVTKNEFINKRLAQAGSMIRKGEGLANSLRSLDIFSQENINAIAIGEESGYLEEMIEKIADICELEAEAAIDKFVDLLEPISILLLGGIIAFIVISVAMPMFKLYVYLD